jgi:hypothetical protein
MVLPQPNGEWDWRGGSNSSALTTEGSRFRGGEVVLSSKEDIVSGGSHHEEKEDSWGRIVIDSKAID